VTSTSIIGAVGGLFVLATVLRLIGQRRIRVQYAGLWLLVSISIALIALVPGLLTRFSSFLGFAVPANFLFFTGLILLVLVGIHHSVAITKLEDRIQRLAEEFALLAEQSRDHRQPPFSREP
jgi:hypothetical protein